MSKPVIASFITALFANLLGVLLFFNPISEGDTTLITVHPAIGLIVYVGLCIGLFQWAVTHMGNAYKAAFLLGASQMALVVDLTLRGQRGVLTGLAGCALLVATWLAVAYVYSKLAKGDKANAA
ncbi:MAG: hypothetical protein AAF438_05705 [Pseudomonadota bacterium]